MTAECCKSIASADNSSDNAERDLAYSAGLCHNLGLMALSHIEPVRTNKVLEAHREPGQQKGLSELFLSELETSHRILTAELARIWSLPAPMVAAYQYRAFPHSHCDDRLGLVVAAGVTAVENTDLDEDLHGSLLSWSEPLGIAADDIQNMAILGNQQRDRVDSLARNMTG